MSNSFFIKNDYFAQQHSIRIAVIAGKINEFQLSGKASIQKIYKHSLEPSYIPKRIAALALF